LVATCSVGRYLTDRSKHGVMYLSLAVGAAAAIMAVRTVMLIPLFLSVALMSIFLWSCSSQKAKQKKIVTLALVLLMLFLSPVLQESLGGYSFDYGALLDSLQSFELNVAANASWSEQSIGLLLIPTNLLESVVFVWPRMLMYLAAPLPSINVDFFSFFDGSYATWENLATVTTSIMMLIFFPFVLAGSSQAWSLRAKYPAMLIIPIAFWVNLLAVAGGNLIIHERYRLMFDILLFTCAWVGYAQAPKPVVKRFSVYWVGLLFFACLFYVIYKL